MTRLERRVAIHHASALRTGAPPGTASTSGSPKSWRRNGLTLAGRSGPPRLSRRTPVAPMGLHRARVLRLLGRVVQVWVEGHRDVPGKVAPELRQGERAVPGELEEAVGRHL